MQQPIDTHVNAVMSRFAVGRQPTGFVAEQVLPVVGVDKQADLYPIFGAEAYRIRDTQVAYGSPIKQGAWTWSTSPYFCDKYGWGIRTPRETQQNADAFLRMQYRNTRYTQDVVRGNQEQRIAAALTNAAVITHGVTKVTTGKWSAIATATPIDDVALAIETVRQSIGVRANTVICSEALRYYLRMNSQIRGRLALTKSTFLVPDAAIQEAFNIERLIWAPAVCDTADEGQTPVMTDIWGDTVVVAYVNPSPDPATEDVSLGYILRWIDWYTKTYYDEPLNSDIVETIVAQDELIIAPTAAYLIIDTI